MQGYELLYIINADIEEDKIKQIHEKIKKALTSNKANIIAEDFIGINQLATPISKQTKGYYIRLEFEADGVAVNEMDKVLEVTDSVLRKMCVKLKSIRNKNKEEAPVS